MKLPKLIKTISIVALAMGSTLGYAQWKYVKQVDKFTGENESYVKIKSKNSQPVGNASQPVTVDLIVFESVANDSFKAALMFSQNSFPVSNSYRGNYCAGSYTCQAMIKIDEGEIIQIPIVDSGRGDKAFVLMRIQDEEKIKNLLEAKKIEMRVEFYNRGEGFFVFNSNGKNALNK